MTTVADSIVSVAVFAPLRQLFDYRTGDVSGLTPGMRVWVPFGRSHRVGVVVARRRAAADELAGLKAVDAALDETALIAPDMLALARWAASYYQHPLGDVLASLLPTRLRRHRFLPDTTRTLWHATAAGLAALPTLGARAARQRELLARLAHGPLEDTALGEQASAQRAALRRLARKGWVEAREVATPAPRQHPCTPGPTLNAAQAAAVDALDAAHATFHTFALHGVTGSGKTEVYLEAIARCRARARQVLVLVPEIALTQHLVERFRRRFGDDVRVLHSGLAEGERVATWEACRQGSTGVLIGTRSAIWVGLPALGLIVVDEEHDASYKQQEGFRYAARDVAIMRARQAAVPVVLGSATPSLETLANLARGRFTRLSLRERALAQPVPSIECVDVRGLTLHGGLSEALLAAMREHLARGEQCMLFLNRRGYAPLLLCRSCGEPRRCDRCDAFLVYHKGSDSARCHHCDRQVPMRRAVACCPVPDIAPLGLGTERVAETVAEHFPAHRVCRMDRDTVRSPAALAGMLDDIAAGRVDILIGTQMVAKGLDFARITLVGIIDADSRLYALDFRAEERLAQLLIQVAGRAGRADKPGRVLIQTHQPQHPILRRIVEQGYEAYAEQALTERREAGLPPFTAMAILRAEGPRPGQAREFLGTARALLLDAGGAAHVSYPIPALMERRAGRYRALVVVSAGSRAAIARVLGGQLQALDELARRARVRFSIDIDPQDTL